MRVPGLFFEFANLFEDGWISPEDAAQVVRDWARDYGVLGRYDTYPTRDGEWDSGRFDDRESVMMFLHHWREASRVLRLFSAATEPGGPDAGKLRALGIDCTDTVLAKEQAMAEVAGTTAKYLEGETFLRLYLSRDDGRLFRGPGFRSLLGAMWLQMSNLLEAPDEDITRCRWCGDIVVFKAGNAPPSDAPRGARGTHKTHSNRKYCKRKHGTENWCKNQYNDARRKRILAKGVKDASKGLHMRDSRPGEWEALMPGLKKVYDETHQADNRVS